MQSFGVLRTCWIRYFWHWWLLQSTKVARQVLEEQNVSIDPLCPYMCYLRFKSIHKLPIWILFLHECQPIFDHRIDNSCQLFFFCWLDQLLIHLSIEKIDQLTQNQHWNISNILVLDQVIWFEANEVSGQGWQCLYPKLVCEVDGYQQETHQGDSDMISWPQKPKKQ